MAFQDAQTRRTKQNEFSRDYDSLDMSVDARIRKRMQENRVARMRVVSGSRTR